MNFLSANSVLILFIYIFNLCNAYHYVVMKAESTASSNDFCAYSNIRPTLPEKITEAKPLEIVSAVDWCTNDSKSNASEQVLLIPAGNCSLDAQLQNFYDMGGKVILLINNGSLVHMNFIDDESLNGTGLSSMTISESSARVLKEMGEIITVKLFKPPSVPGVYFLLTIGAIAIFTAAVGSYVSGLTSYKIFSERVTNTSGAGNEVPEVHRLQDQRLQNRWFRLQQFLTGLLKKIEIGEENGTPVIVLNPCIVIYLIITLVFSIVIGYLLKEYLLVVSLVVFTYTSIFCLRFCLYSWTSKYRSYFWKCTFVVSNKKRTISSLSVILQIVSIGVPLVWLIFRKTKYVWILQNILCMFLCFGFLRFLRLQSLKACTILLLLLFFFDIFFVNVTPLFTKSGNSVMGELATAGNIGKLSDPDFTEEVAAGRKHFEFMPSLFQVRDIGLNPYGACFQAFALLGLGDIVMPGLLLSYCYAFDLCSNNKMIYYPTSVISYAIGIFLSNLAVSFSFTEQPALLFLVPSVLLPVVLLGWYRGELGTLWYGLEVIKRTYGRRVNNTDGQNTKNDNLPLDQQTEAT